jgi:hypothetical protein
MDERICTVPDCGKPLASRGWCNAHYFRVMRYGRLNLLTTEDRFWAKVDKSGDCWLWTGAKNEAGYGRVTIRSQGLYAHRVAFEWMVGPIPAGFTLDHLCRVHACVNPEHLEPVSQSENVLRGLSPEIARARQLSKTHCPSGHPYDELNTYIRPSGGRECRTCAKHARKRSAA